MKKLILIPFLLGCVASFAQLTLKRADKYFEELDFEKAAYYYNAYLHNKDDHYSQLQLAKIHTYLNEPEQAERWYREVIHRDDLEPVHYLKYAQILSSLGKYEEAMPFYAKYQEVADDKMLANEKVYGIQHLEDFYADSNLVDLKLMEGNSWYMDFVPSFYKNTIVFSSGRGNKFGIQRKTSWNNKNFLDLYTKDEEGEVVKFEKGINTKFHEGATSFTADGNTIFFTRSNFLQGHLGRGKDGISKIKIYSSTKDENGKWGEIEEFKYNSPDYSTGDPHISADGNILYFVSDMPGGFGGTDIYKRLKTSTGEWGEPINLGHTVNTEGNERTPFLTDNNELFFASEGHLGLGGQDIYVARAHNGTYDEIENVGYPINSNRDDFGLIINSTTREGYFSSNRENGKGSDDIYWFHKKENPKVKVSGTVYSKSEDKNDKKTLEGSTVTVLNKTSGESKQYTSDNNGEFALELKPGSKYVITGTNSPLLQDQQTIDLTNKEIKTVSPLELVLVKKALKPTRVKIEGNIKDAKTNSSLGSTPIYLLNTKTKKVQKVVSDANGNYSFDLDPNTEYVMKSEANGYLVNCTSFRTPAASKKTQKLNQPLYLDKLEVNTKLEVENLYYDLGKSDIRPDAAVELNKVVQFIKDNPGITVELGAHTDARGSASFNASLSAKRAKSARDYVVSQGISPSSITYKGYGEKQIMNRCKDGVKCSDDEHANNRRTEIKITAINSANTNSNSLTIDNAFDASQTYNCNRVAVVTK